MMPYLVLLIAALTRLVPHALHGVGLNFTGVGGGLLFFGARRPRWQALIAAGVMAATDVYLTVHVYASAFHATGYLVTWAWYAGVCLIGASQLRKPGFWRVAGAVAASATSFFLLSNLMVWLTSGMYPHSLTGVGACFALALPFYANDLVSTGLTATVLFGLPVAAEQIVSSWRTVMEHNQRLD